MTHFLALFLAWQCICPISGAGINPVGNCECKEVEDV